MKLIYVITVITLTGLFCLAFEFAGNRPQSAGNYVHTPESKPAPEIKAEKWINTDKALTLESLKGKVVVIEFWTFACYNCKNTLPYMKAWYGEFKNSDFEMIGIHCPELDRERDFDNVAGAVKEYGIIYPVAIDNAFYNWYNYDVNAWPTLFIIDKSGNIRYSHVGEGSYKKTEEKIRELLTEN